MFHQSVHVCEKVGSISYQVWPLSPLQCIISETSPVKAYSVPAYFIVIFGHIQNIPAKHILAYSVPAYLIVLLSTSCTGRALFLHIQNSRSQCSNSQPTKQGCWIRIQLIQKLLKYVQNSRSQCLNCPGKIGLLNFTIKSTHHQYQEVQFCTWITDQVDQTRWVNIQIYLYLEFIGNL